MSDVQLQQDWWQATDGKWYPPERHPEYRPRGIPPAGLPPLPQSLEASPPVGQPSRQMIQAERTAPAPETRVAGHVMINRRFRLRRLPCGHCAAKLPRFTALAPAMVVCPECANRNQVMEGVLFRRGYAVA
jgi:hypothetical protein